MIIGVGGAIGSGKDTIARCLVMERGFAIHRCSDALKREVTTTLSETMAAYAREHFGSGLVERDGVDALVSRLLHDERTPVTRALLQEWGTDLRRAEDADYWVRHLAQTLADRNMFESVVIPDVRFENEARLVRTLRGHLVRVHRPVNPLRPSSHVSELALARWGDWDHTFVNDGTIEDLEREVLQWVDGLSASDAIVPIAATRRASVARRANDAPRGAGLRHPRRDPRAPVGAGPLSTLAPAGFHAARRAGIPDAGSMITRAALARTLWRCREEAWRAVYRSGVVMPFTAVDRETRAMYLDMATRLLGRYHMTRKARKQC